MVDIRFPIGLMFSILGLMLIIYGFATTGSEIYKQSFGFNINLWVGLSMLIFGGLMLLFIRVGKKKLKK